jgi:hypothetical protein
MQTAVSAASAVALENSLPLSELEQGNLHLSQTRDAALGSVAGLSEAQWNFQPSPDRWSIAKILEHVVVVQERVLAIVRDQLPAGAPPPPDQNAQLVDAIVINQFPNRLMKANAPEFLEPSGDRTIADVRDRLQTNTRRLAECLETIPDLRRHVLDAPPLKFISKGEYTVMDGYQWILAASAHAERHTKQILEVKANPQFPAA